MKKMLTKSRSPMILVECALIITLLLEAFYMAPHLEASRKSSMPDLPFWTMIALEPFWAIPVVTLIVGATLFLDVFAKGKYRIQACLMLLAVNAFFAYSLFVLCSRLIEPMNSPKH